MQKNYKNIERKKRTSVCTQICKKKSKIKMSLLVHPTGTIRKSFSFNHVIVEFNQFFFLQRKNVKNYNNIFVKVWKIH